MAEVRVMQEGTLRFVQASGSGNSWATASAPASGTVGYVQSFSHDSGQKITTISERGIPVHHKLTEKSPIKVTFQFLHTGSTFSYLTASGATMPLVHLEWRASAAELGAGSGVYYQYYGCALESIKVKEANDGNTVDMSFVTVGMVGATASGYLS